MNEEKKYIGFDLGAESGRCIVAVLKDDRITLHEVHRFTTHTLKLGDSSYWNVNAIFEEMLKGLNRARTKFGSGFNGIGVDTWGVDYVLINKEGNDIGNPYHYRDDRTDGMMDEAFSVIPKDELYSTAGTQSAQYNTLFQLLAEKKNNLNLLDFSDTFLLMPDYFNYRLCGNKKAEYSIASTTNLVNPLKRDWNWNLIKTFNLPKNIFPVISEPGTILGKLLPSIADLVGLNNDIPIIATTGHDTASAVASIPASGNNWAFISSGTWSLMGIESDKPIINKDSLKYNFTNEGGFNKTTRFLKNIVGLWPLQECRQYWNEHKQEFNYNDLTLLAARQGLANAWIDLNDSRFLKPGNMPQKVLDFLKETNQKHENKPGFITAVILESLAFTYRKTLREIEVVTGKKIEKLHIVGGGIQNELLTQYTADATGKTVVAGPIEGAGVGNIGAQAIATGAIKDIKELRKIVAGSFSLKEYKPINTKYFEDNEENYDRILQS
ncbi:MAG: rhamnulokinase [Ignavibacteriales bacterium]|nr:MAG: rhamnulokinase [Ignavibacteriales bacterium]